MNPDLQRHDIEALGAAHRADKWPRFSARGDAQPMNLSIGQIPKGGSPFGSEALERKQVRIMSRALFAAALICVIASGALLWGRYGGAIFNDMVLATLAWCF
jgi:hypothetical protein